MSNSLGNRFIPKFYIYNTLLISFFWRGQCCIHLLKWYSPCFCFAVFRLSLMKTKTGYSAMRFTVKGWVVRWSERYIRAPTQKCKMKEKEKAATFTAEWTFVYRNRLEIHMEQLKQDPAHREWGCEEKDMGDTKKQDWDG